MAVIGLSRTLLGIVPLLLLPLSCGSSKADPIPFGHGGGGGADGGAGGDAAAAVKLADLPARLAETACAVTEQCLGATAKTPGVDCVKSTEDKLAQGEFSLLKDAIDAKRVSYDGTKVTACTDALMKAGCGLLTQRISTLCAGVVAGTVATGETCTLNAECRSGLFCDRTRSGGDGGTVPSCPGTCGPLLAAGELCATSDECKDGLLCSHGKCAAPAKEGAACSKEEGPDCLPNLACVGSPGTCKTLDSVLSGAEGDTCDLTGTLCKTGLVCAIVGVTGGKLTFQCEKPATAQKCHVGFPESCPAGQFCELPTGTVDGLCKILPGDGEACAKQIPSDPKSPATLCRAAAVCDAPGGTCHDVQKNGGKCTIDAECLSGLCSVGACVATGCAK